MLLPKIIDAINLATQTSNNQGHSYDLDKIQLKNSTIYASNANSLYYAHLPHSYDDIEYPQDVSPDGASLTIEPADPIYLDSKAVKKAIANRPKKGPLSILQDSIQLSTTPTHIHLSTTDLDSTDTVTTKNGSTTVCYPHVETIINSVNSPDKLAPLPRTTNLSITELELLCKVAKKAGETHVTIAITDDCSPVKVTPHNESFHAILMPCRKD